MVLKRIALLVSVILVAALVASSALVLSDQVKAAKEPAPLLATGGGCGGGCSVPGAGGGPCGSAAPAKPAPVACPATEAVAQRACPKAAQGNKCDPATCPECKQSAAAAKAKAAPGGCGMDHATAGACPATAKPKATVSCPHQAKGEKCDPASCSQCKQHKATAKVKPAAASCPLKAKGQKCDPATCATCKAKAQKPKAKPAPAA